MGIARAHPTRGVLVSPRYLLTCQFDSMGPTAQLTDPQSGAEYTIDAFNRAAFLYAVLERTGTDNEGWVPCEVVARAVWGRRASANNVNTLVYRIRRELKAHGFDPEFIEVKRGHVRLAAPDSFAEPEHTDEVKLFNNALQGYRNAQTDAQRDAARKQIDLAAERVALVPNLLVEPKSG